MGLLDTTDEDTNAAITSGLLNFVQMAGKKRPFAGLLAGVSGYEGTLKAARELELRKAMEERKLAIEEEFKRAQIGEYQAQAQQRLAAIRDGEAKAAQEQNFLRDLAPRQIGAAEALAGGGGPTVANAARMGQVVGPDLAELALRYPARAKQLEELAGRGNWGRPEVARTINGKDDNGLPVTLQFDKFGGKVGSPTQQWKAPVEVNQGDRRTFIDPTTMQPLGGFGVNQSPDSKAGNAVTMRGQNMTDARSREANSAALSKPFEVTGPDGNPMLVQQDKSGGLRVVEGFAPKGDSRPLPQAALKQMTEARDNAATIDRLSQSFKKDFAGKGVFGLGADMQMGVSGNIGVDKESVEWWKNYRKQAELIERHALFGAALTPTEQSSWRAADISPGMHPDVIERNLKTRSDLSKRVMSATKQDLIDAGHSARRIEAIAGRTDSPGGPSTLFDSADAILRGGR